MVVVIESGQYSCYPKMRVHMCLVDTRHQHYQRPSPLTYDVRDTGHDMVALLSAGASVLANSLQVE